MSFTGGLGAAAILALAALPALHGAASLVLLGAGMLLLDVAVQCGQVANQARIFALPGAARARRARYPGGGGVQAVRDRFAGCAGRGDLRRTGLPDPVPATRSGRRYRRGHAGPGYRPHGRGSLKLDGVRGLVLDEADEMLRMGFAEEVDWILTQTPSERQTVLFSATMPDAIRRIAQRHLRNPAEITIKQRAATADTVRQRCVVVGPQEKQEVLARVLEAESIEGVLIFVNTKSTTEPLAEFLSSRGHRTAALSRTLRRASASGSFKTCERARSM